MTVQRAGRGLRPRLAGVGHRQVAEPGGKKAVGDQRRHVAAAHQQAGAAAQVAVQVLGHLHRRGGDGNRPLADGGLAAHPFGGAVGRLQKRLQLAPVHAGVAGHAVAGLHLAQDLGLADHQAVEGRGDREDVTHRFCARQNVELAVEVGGRQLRVLGHDLGDTPGGVLGIVVDRLHLDALARRQHHGLLDPRPAQALEEGRHRGIFHEQAIAHRQGTGAVVGADDERPAFRERNFSHGGANGSGRGGSPGTPAARPTALRYPCRGPSPRRAPARPRPATRWRGR